MRRQATSVESNGLCRAGPSRRSDPATRGLTLIEVVTTATVLALVLGLLLPAVNSAREKARQTTCANRLRQLGLALTTYAETHRTLPPGQVPYDPLGGSGAGWAAQLLPVLGEDGLYAELDFSADMTFSDAGRVNLLTASERLEYFLCPSDARDHISGRAASNYVGNRGATHLPEADDGVLFDNSYLPLSAIRDGLANTILLLEVAAREPGDSAGTPASWCGWQMAHVAPAGPINDPRGGPERTRSGHPGGVYSLFCDGSARFLSEKIDARFEPDRTRGVLGALLTRAGREPLDDRQF